jgi:hypothetical protein
VRPRQTGVWFGAGDKRDAQTRNAESHQKLPSPDPVYYRRRHLGENGSVTKRHFALPDEGQRRHGASTRS